MFGLKKKTDVRVLRLPKMEWTTDDMKISAAFVKSLTFKKMVTWCNEQLLAKILHHGASEDYRKGYMDALKHVGSFTQEPQILKDSFEQTSMQMEDE